MSQAWIARFLTGAEYTLQGMLLLYLLSLEVLVLLGDGLENTWKASLIIAEAVYVGRKRSK